jgi:hypothetical protein
MSTIKVDKIEKRSGSTLTLGGPGTAVTLACGATQSGFGRAGSVNWCSTIYTNSPGTVTATSGKGFFLNTTSGAITINLPSSPNVGDIVAIKDYASTFGCNAVTVGRGGSKIGGLCLDATLGTEGESVTLIYADSTRGWLNVNTDSTITGSTHVAATGGTESTSGDYKIHTFTSSGTFQVTAAGSPPGSTKISYMVIAGGGGGARDGAGGAGAGGYREGKCSSDPYTASPLAATPCSALTASIGSFPISVGAGGSVGAGCTIATQGGSSIFSTITSAGGGRAGQNPSPNTAGGDGGSGGGGRSNVGAAGGAGNTPPVSPPQGNPGGSSAPSSPPYNQWGGGGGGGAGGAGSNYPPGGQGGAGVTSSINATPTVRASGGAGGSNNPAAPAAAATPGGGGAGGSSPGGNGGAGTANTGGGGGSGACGGSPSVGGAGGSGIVIVRYKFQN